MSRLLARLPVHAAISAEQRARQVEMCWRVIRLASDNAIMQHLSRAQLEAGLGHVLDSPRAGGALVLLVRRPAVGVRELTAEATLDQASGVVGDNWLDRGSSSTPDRSADPQRQVTVMNARLAELVAGSRDRIPLAGDQLYVDLDISVGNLPAGSLLTVGDAVLEVSAAPHLGCAKFVARFGTDAMRFVNSRAGRQLRLRGMNTRVVQAGTVHLGDRVSPSREAAPRADSDNGQQQQAYHPHQESLQTTPARPR